MKTNRILGMALVAFMVGTIGVFAQQPQQPERGRHPGPQPGEQTAMQQHPGAPQGDAQGERKELTEEERIAMQTKRMSRELLLDEATAEKFAPIYTEYLTEMAKLRGEKPERPEVKEGETPEPKEMTDDELIAKVKERAAQMREMATLQEKYIDKFAKVLNARQLAQVYARPQGHGPRHQGFGHGPRHGGPEQGQPGQPQAGQPNNGGQGHHGGPMGGPRPDGQAPQGDQPTQPAE